MEEEVDYLVLGSGLSSLAFSSLMAKRGHSVKILEAHEHFGGYGHTFTFGEYRFNAQLHYVTSCGEDDLTHTFLERLGLEKEVKFHLLNKEGFDRVYCDGKVLNIPLGFENLRDNMLEICPEAEEEISGFIDLLIEFRQAAEHFPRHMQYAYKCFKALPSYLKLFRYRNATLQEVFDAYKLPKILQTLVSGQLLDYMLPPKDLSFLVWAALVNGYCRGAYYPTKHFEHFVDSVITSIKGCGGALYSNQCVVEFITEGKTVKGVYTQEVNPKTGVCDGVKTAHYGKTVVCNFDPQFAAEMIGKEKFSSKLRTKLDYDYSYSSFVLYGIVEGIDLREYGFGDWNIWHCQPDHNKAFEEMHDHGDYTNPYFGMNCRSLHSPDNSNCTRPNSQMFEIITVGNYEYWKTLKLRDHRAYNLRKKEVLDQLLDVVEAKYVPEIKKHLVFRMTGSPTTNERYVNAPGGGCYGINLTPRNFQFSRKLNAETSLKNFYFCCAASGAGGFAGTIMTGIQLYEKLTQDYLD